jgi:hypothetical protein
MDNKLQDYLKIAGILNNVFRPQFFLYGSETWTVKARDTKRITAAEMNCMTRTAGYTLTDYKTNTQITKELNII